MTTAITLPTAVTVPTAPAPAEVAIPRNSTVNRVLVMRTLTAVSAVGLLVLCITVMRPYLEHALDVIRHPELWWLGLGLLAEVASMGAFARTQKRMLRAGGVRVSPHKVMALVYAANALNTTLPGGSLLSAGYSFRRMRRWGANRPLAGFTLVASGLLSTVAFGIITVSVALLAGAAEISPVLAGVGLVLAAGLAVLAYRVLRDPQLLVGLAQRGLRMWNRVRRNDPSTGLARAEQLGNELQSIHVSRRDWAVGLTFATANWVADFICLFACCRAVGIDLGIGGISLAVVAYVAGMSVSSLSLLPGGLGIVDTAMIVTFSHGGLAAVAATPGVLLYRLVSVVFIVALGWVLWTVWWAADRRAKRREPEGIPAAAVDLAA